MSQKRTAAHAFSENATDSKKLMSILFEKLAETDAPDADWGHVGDAAHMREQLMHLVIGITCGNGGDEAETEAEVNETLAGMAMPFIDAHVYPRRG